MKSTDSLVPLKDIISLLQRVTCNKEVTIKHLLKEVELDLSKEKKPLENLKALNYFMLFVSTDVSTDSLDVYEPVLQSCFFFLNFIGDNDNAHGTLLGSVINSTLKCIARDRMFLHSINFIEQQLDAFNKSNSIDNYAYVSRALIVLDKLCNQVISHSMQDLSILFPETLAAQIIHLIFELPLEVLRTYLVSSLPNFILSQSCNRYLDLLWNCIEKSAIKGQDIERHLFLLCLLADHFIVLSQSSCSYPLYEKPLFWSIIQNGIVDVNNLSRKQALYLLKRYVSALEEANFQFETDLFFWFPEKKADLILFWDKVFTLLETLEEKQIHLIMPAVKNIHEFHFICKTNEKICFSWLSCIFLRIMSHSSGTLIKWGLNEFCMLPTNLLFCERKCQLMLTCFFKSLNDMFLYCTNNSSMPENNLLDSLIKWFTSISDIESDSSPFEVMLQHLADSSWSPVPLFFVTFALSKVPKTHLWNADCFSFIQKILLETLNTQCIFIRSAIQCNLLQCIIQLSKADVGTSSIINIIGHFNSQESLSRGSGMWKNCVSWIKSCFCPQNGCELIELCKKRLFSEEISTMSINACARGIILFSDAGLFKCNEELSQLLCLVFEQFVDCKKRVYSCAKKQDRCAAFLMCIINEINFSLENHTYSDLLPLIKPSVHNLLQFVELKLSRGSVDSIEQVELYISVLDSVISNLSLLETLHNELLSVYELALNKLKTENLLFFQEYFLLQVVFICYNCIAVNQLNKEIFVTPFNTDIVEIILKKRLFNKKSIQTVLDPATEKNMRGKLMSEIMKTLWSVLNIYLRLNLDIIDYILDIFSISMLVNSALKAICEDGKQALVPLLKSFVILLPYNENFDCGIQLITKSWQACFELRKSELFWMTISEWIVMVYQENILSIKEYNEVLLYHAKTIMEFGDELVGLVDILMDQLNKCHISSEFASIISDGLTFGGIARKDKRVEDEVCQYIIKKVEEGSMTSFGIWKGLRNDKEVRLKAMNLLLKPGMLSEMNELIICIIKALLLQDEALGKNSKRYFNDSITHRKKHRILQVLLILESYIYHNPSPQFQGLPETIFTWVFESLQGTNQQPSVRYQLEWLFVLLSIHYPDFINNFWELFEKAGKERIGSMCSFISIAYHLSVLLKEDSFLEKCIENIIPWCMCQNFNIRLYAQVVLSKLWDLNPKISDRYNFIRISQWKTCEQGNMLANAKKMQSDFYFSTFHPIHHFTLQTIFWDLPRLSNISSEEWIHPTVLEKYSNFINNCTVTTFVPSLESCSSPTWISRISGDLDSESDQNSIQKKFIPWKGMFPELDEKHERAKSGIIVVGSLIDKAANLGGLARTCEIFAAKEFVVPSLEVTKDREFVGLSMTAEKHIPITEVRPYNLQEYLKLMKSMGYLLVGAEQTTGSVPLIMYNFPKDCVLLLGSEREGIPANLISLLDYCVEIPQLGVVRSLNVHVSGALLLWEYSKQYSFKPT